MRLKMLNYAVLAVIVCSAAASDFTPRSAVAYLSNGDIQGNITFRQINEKQVAVEGSILGLAPGKYGFHVHEKGDLRGGCASAGSHFNPHGKEHGGPTATERHVGDLGNVEFDANHIARIDYIDDQISLYGLHNILGRSVVLHQGQDDLGLGKHPDSLTTGNAGGRAACAIIGVLDPVTPWSGATTASVSIVAFIASSIFALLISH